MSEKQTKTKFRRIRLSPDEVELIDRVAFDQTLTFSEFARFFVVKAAKENAFAG